MTADEFVQELAAVAPTVEQFIEKGFSEETARRLRQTYFTVPRPGAKRHEKFEMLNFLYNYHADYIEIGRISFLDEPKTYEEISTKFVQIGEWDLQYIFLDTQTGMIFIYNPETEVFNLWACASSSEKFFDALVYIQKQKSPNSPTDRYNTESEKVAKECSILAGSIDYLPVWETL